MTGPRERMVASAALLIRERGAHPTAIADVLAHSGAPRGSAYHYFPGGRTQLLCEAIDYAGDYVMAKLTEADSAAALLDGMIATYRTQLLRSDFRAGCPVVAVSVEAGDPQADAPDPVVARAGTVFTRWAALISDRLRSDGAARDRADELATLILSALEGAIVIARATRDITPLDQIHGQLRTLLPEGTPS